MSLKRFLAIYALVACLLATSFAQSSPKHLQPTVTPQDSGTANRLIAVSPVNENVVWTAGAHGTYAVTIDGGKTWRAAVMSGAENLEFRDVQAFSQHEAYLLSIGDNPTDFRIYKTTDGGQHWSIQFQNHRDGAFYDCFAFWNPKRGLLQGDSIKGVLPELRTLDGEHWQDIGSRMPSALPDEASFASSGTCVATFGESNAWIATGGAAIARIFATHDGGDTWSAYNTPLVSRPKAGAFTVAFRDSQHGMVGGGDLDPADRDHAATATSSDGGKTWTLSSPPPVTGAIYGLAYISPSAGAGDYGRAVVITANAGGAAWTPDEGKMWYPLAEVTNCWGVAFANPQAGWLVGAKGKIVKIAFPQPR